MSGIHMSWHLNKKEIMGIIFPRHKNHEDSIPASAPTARAGLPRATTAPIDPQRAALQL